MERAPESRPKSQGRTLSMSSSPQVEVVAAEQEAPRLRCRCCCLKSTVTSSRCGVRASALTMAAAAVEAGVGRVSAGASRAPARGFVMPQCPKSRSASMARTRSHWMRSSPARRATSQRSRTWICTAPALAAAEEEEAREAEELTTRPRPWPACSLHWSARSCPTTPTTSSHRAPAAAFSSPPSPSPPPEPSARCSSRPPRRHRALRAGARSRPRAGTARPSTARARYSWRRARSPGTARWRRSP